LKLQAIASQHDWKRDWMNDFHRQSLSKHHHRSRKQSGCDDMKISGFDDWAHRVIFALHFNNAIDWAGKTCPAYLYFSDGFTA